MADPKDPKHLENFLTEWAPHIRMHVTKLKNQGKVPAHIEESDLHTAGMHGLYDAILRYDPDRGANFANFAGRRISGKMLDHITSSQDSSAIPKLLRDQAKAHNKKK